MAQIFKLFFFNEVKPFFKLDLTVLTWRAGVSGTSYCHLGLGCDCQITYNLSRCAWRLWWARRRKNGTSGPAWPRGTHWALEGPGGKVWAAGPSCTRRLPSGLQPGQPTPLRDVYAPAGGRQRSVQDHHVTEQTLWVFLGQPLHVSCVGVPL